MSGAGSIMLAAGGTGGHLFPAFALAEVLGRRGVAVDLITDERGDRYGVGFPARAVYQVPAATASGKNPVKAAYAALTLSRGVAAAHKILGEVAPGAVIGFGGYPTFPPLLAAKLRGIPTAVHEQNAVLGRANRMLAARVDRIAMSFAKTRNLDGALSEKSVHTGNPVRAIVLEAARYPYQPPEPNGPIGLLVFGGSQGARFFSNTVPPALATLPPAIRARLQVVQQARPEDVSAVESAYRYSGIAAQVAPFFKDLPIRIAWSHLVIGRAGASTIAELTVIGRPSILVPLPHALDNDQLENARQLAESGGAWCIEEKNLDVDALAGAISSIISQPAALSGAAAAAKAVGRPNAAERLADLAMELMARARV
jgi:UDP-N-acetylglucosamine--N-acetylmuramyl-(pentapeptide) pyrophosphoryl-undecaprenol N-acetylglucosamine transferase